MRILCSLPLAVTYLLIQDCCGIVCAFFTWLLILYGEFVVLRVILLPSFPSVYSVVNLIVFQGFATLAVASHIRTMLTDPVGMVTVQSDAGRRSNKSSP